MLVAHDTHVMVIDAAHKSLLRNRGKDFALDLERIDHRQRHTPRTSDMGCDKAGRSFQSGAGARSA